MSSSSGEGSSSSPPSSQPPTTQSEVMSEALANCLLSQYRFSAAGIGLGTAYTLRYKKGFIPMIAAGAVGTTADMAYGFLVECLEFRQSEKDDKPEN